jgi:hypothetical protein
LELGKQMKMTDKRTLRFRLQVMRRKEPATGLVNGRYPEPKPPRILMTAPPLVRYANCFSQGSRSLRLIKGAEGYHLRE